MIEEPQERYINYDSVDNLVRRFNLPSRERYMQDWEIEVSGLVYSNNKIMYLIDSYNEINDEDEKFALISLIIASLDEFIRDIQYKEKPLLEEFDKHWKKVKNILYDDFKIHKYTIYYWYCSEAETYDEIFSITPYIRGLNVDF